MRLSRTGPSSLVASILVHCVLVAVGAWIWATRPGPSHLAPALEVTLDEAETEPGGVPDGNSGTEALRVPVERPQAELAGGGEQKPRPDVGQPGRGGTREGERASNLSSSIDPLTLERDPTNHLRRSEVQRLAVARVRRTRDDRRATPRPMELGFVASGRGRLQARRPVAETNPGPGRNVDSLPQEAGRNSGSDPGDNAIGAIGERTPGGERMPAAGLPAAVQGEVRRSAAILMARPWVPQERAAVPAQERGRPSDTLDSQQRVATRVAALMQASTLGGDAQSGIGGEPGPNLPAMGADYGSGSRSAPTGNGKGPQRDLGLDPALEGYYRRVLSRLDEALRGAFPRWAIAEGRGGLVVFELVLRDDGRVARVDIVRPSGIDEYDRNVVLGVRGVTSFGRMPSAFNGRAVLRISWDSMNPVVGRKGPGPGQQPQ